MAAPTRSITHITRIENSGWSRVPGDGDTERCEFTVTLSDGSTRTAGRAMVYVAGERQGIVERAITGKATAEDLRRVQQIRGERWRKVEEMYGSLQREYRP